MNGQERKYKVIFVLQRKSERLGLTTAAQHYAIGDEVVLKQLRDFASELGLVYERDDKNRVYIKDMHGAAHLTAEQI